MLSVVLLRIINRTSTIPLLLWKEREIMKTQRVIWAQSSTADGQAGALWAAEGS